MDYPLLDSPAINDIRTRIKHDNDWGAGFYSLMWQLPPLLDSIVSSILSVVLILPLFIQDHMFTDITAFFLLLVFAAIILSNIWFISLKKKNITSYWTIIPRWIKVILDIFYGREKITIMEKMSASIM